MITKEGIAMNEKSQKTPNKAKKRLIIIILSILALMLILLGISLMIDLVESKKSDEFEIDYNFYPADYDENIFEDEKYCELIAGEFIRYCDSTTNVTVGIDTESAISYGDEVDFLARMIYDIINGDHIAYNSRFSDVYYEEHEPKGTFTMQKIYDVKITFMSKKKIDNYTKSYYCVEYKIYQNNGTFRRDIGDGSKKQYINITDENGELLIDSMSTVITKY